MTALGWFAQGVSLVLLFVLSVALYRARTALRRAGRNVPYLRGAATALLDAKGTAVEAYVYENGLLYNIDALARDLARGGVVLDDDLYLRSNPPPPARPSKQG
jgi:hypothetical protein